MGHLIIILSGKRICYELGGMKNENFTFRVKLNKNALLTKIHFVKERNTQYHMNLFLNVFKIV